MKLHKYKTNYLSKEHLQTAVFPVLCCSLSHSLYWVIWTIGIKTIAFLCHLGWGFMTEILVECFTSDSLCLLKSNWIDTLGNNYASSACCSYHLPTAQQRGHIPILSSDSVTVIIQRLVLRNVNHISSSFSS